MEEVLGEHLFSYGFIAITGVIKVEMSPAFSSFSLFILNVIGGVQPQTLID